MKSCDKVLSRLFIKGLPGAKKYYSFTTGIIRQKVNDIDKAQTIYKLARVLGCNMDDLLEKPEEEYGYNTSTDGMMWTISLEASN